MAQLESQAERADAVPDDGSPKYMPSTEDTDPIVRALKTVLKCKEVTGEIFLFHVALAWAGVFIFGVFGEAPMIRGHRGEMGFAIPGRW